MRRLFILFALTRLAYGNQENYWPHYGNNEKGHRFSNLTQINRDNVNQVRVAWTYHYGEAGNSAYAHEATPIMVRDGSVEGRELLIFCTPWNDLIALEPATGSEVWKQTGASANNPSRYTVGPRTCRGLATWIDPLKADGDPCRRMVYMGTLAAMLVAVDAATGDFCPEFGDGGKLNLTVENAVPDNGNRQVYGFTTGPVIVGETVIIGDNMSDGISMNGPYGQPRGFHCRTGRRKWVFYPIPQNETDPAYRTWWNGTKGIAGGNVWAPISADEETGTVYLPTSSAHYDHWGGTRMGENKYTDCVVALDAETGDMKWYYQTVRHDLWNYDVACQPVPVTIDHEGTQKKAVLQLTKMGMLFILDALTGEPLYPVEDRPVPPTEMPDDYAWPTQPFPVGELGRLIPQTFSMDDLFHLTEEQYQGCRHRLLDLFKIPNGTGQLYTPARTDRSTIFVPGELGGGNWMSLAVDPDRQVAYLPLNHLVLARQLLRNNETNTGYCGSGPMIGGKYHSCVGRFFYGDLMIPCYKPPWARLVAVDLRQGKIKWQRPYASPLGAPEILKKEYGARRVIGGVIVTASGLVFATGGEDQRLWAYDSDTGEELWESEEMDYDPTSIPMTYMSGGRQFIVVNSGGHWTSPFPRGDMIYAFALPENYTEPITTATPGQTTTTTKPCICPTVSAAADHKGSLLAMLLVLLAFMGNVHT